MFVPATLVALQDQGVIDSVVRPLKSGKEAEVYLVRSEGELRVAKVYKSMNRSFKQRALYIEGRKLRNTRDQRAINRRTRHGKQQEEDAWKAAEVDTIHRLHAAGVRVPTPYHYIDGVLIMELVKGADGDAAPRLAEADLDSKTAAAYYEQLIREVIKMLCVGIVHGDLSDYNVLVDDKGPVVIDFPQAVDAATNRNAKKLLLRDVENLGAFVSRLAPAARGRSYGREIWNAFENNQLSPDMKLSGKVKEARQKTDVGDVLGLIDEADADERERRGEGRQSPQSPRYRRMQVVETATPKSSGPKPKPRSRGKSRGKPRSAQGANQRLSRGAPQGQKQGQKQATGRDTGQRVARGGEDAEAPPPKRRRRRRRGGQSKPSDGAASSSSSSSSSSVASDERTRRPPRSAPKTSDQAPSASQGDAQAPSSRRRRRRRRGPRKPPEGKD